MCASNVGMCQANSPDIHLVAARAICSGASVGASTVPALDIGLAVDELDIMRALRVAVARSVLGTGLVGCVLGQATVLVHCRKVDCAVEATGQVGDVDVKGKLLVQQVEHAVLSRRAHEVVAASDILAIAVLGHEAELQSTGAGRGDAIGATVVCSVESAVLSASLAIRALGCVPRITGIAVRVAPYGVSPAPVGVQHNCSLLGSAGSRCRTRLDGKRRVSLCGVRAHF